ncbi:MAG: hypothetical protein WAO95_17900 [Burkholderiales bacterium]
MALWLAAAGSAIAHPGHGAPERHFHGWGVEHGLLLLVFLLFLFVAFRGKD